MAPRIILYTGKGGVGKTSVAAATALRCAAEGLRTVVLSTDPAHSLSDSFETPLGAEPTPLSENLFGQEVQAQEEMERHWDGVQAWLGDLLAKRGVDRISAEELTVPPGMDELFSLLWIKRHHEEGQFDCVVVDCAPTGETLRLLSFPDVVTWWLEKVLPSQRRLAPFAKTLFDMPMPGDAVFEDVERLARNLVAMNEILRDRAHTSIRLVMNPERMVVKEAMRTFTYLNLYGYLTDAVVVNRVLPERAAEGYFEAWRATQQEHLELVRSAFAPLPILEAPFFDREVVGTEMLDRLAGEVFADHAPAEVLHTELGQVLATDNGSATLSLPLPLAERGEINLKKIGLEVIVRVGGQKRTILLPPALAAYATSGARFEDGALHIFFEKTGGSPCPRLIRTTARAWTRRPPRPTIPTTCRARARPGRAAAPARTADRPGLAVRDPRRAAPRRSARARAAGHEPGAGVPAHPALADRLVPGAARPPGSGAPGGGHPDRLIEAAVLARSPIGLRSSLSRRGS